MNPCRKKEGAVLTACAPPCPLKRTINTAQWPSGHGGHKTVSTLPRVELDNQHSACRDQSYSDPPYGEWLWETLHWKGSQVMEVLTEAWGEQKWRTEDLGQMKDSHLLTTRELYPALGKGPFWEFNIFSKSVEWRYSFGYQYVCMTFTKVFTKENSCSQKENTFLKLPDLIKSI